MSAGMRGFFDLFKTIAAVSKPAAGVFFAAVLSEAPKGAVRESVKVNYASKLATENAEVFQGRSPSILAEYCFPSRVASQWPTDTGGILQWICKRLIVFAATNPKENSKLFPRQRSPFYDRRRIYAKNPGPKARERLFRYYLSKISVADDVDTKLMAERTTEHHIRYIVDLALMRAALEKKSEVNMEYLENARRSEIYRRALAEWTAYHEAGHALVAYFTPHIRPVEKLSMVPDTRSLGRLSYKPPDETFRRARSHLLAEMDVYMGAYVAEESFFAPFRAEVIVGTDHDVRLARTFATYIVGPRTFDHDTGLDPDEQIEMEIDQLVEDSYQRAKAIIEKHPKAHKRLADALLERKTLTAEEIKVIIECHRLDNDHDLI